MRTRRFPRAIRDLRHHWRTRVYVVSFPKAGRTWLRVMLGRALTEAYQLPEDLLLDTYLLTRKAGVHATRLTHDGSSIIEGRSYRELSSDKRKYRHKSVILLVRDARDTVVSCFFQATKRVGRFDGTLSEFIRDERYGIEKILTFYNTWHKNLDVPRDCLVLHYEDVHQNPNKVLAETLAFVGAHDVEDEIIRSAVEYSTFDRMKDLEKTARWTSDIMRPGSGIDEEGLKVRRGVVGGYRDYLSEEDMQYVERAYEQHGWAFGREVDPRRS